MSYKKNFLLFAASVALFAPAIMPSASQAAALSGSYGFGRMLAGFPGSTEATVLAGSGSITFNSDGNCSARFDDTELRLNLTTGNVASSSGSQDRTCSYSAASTGDLSVTFTDNNATYRGSVTADSASLNLAGPDSETPGKVQMLLAHKSGSGLTTAALSGSYPVAWTAAGFPGAAESKVAAGTGTIAFDGKGGCTADLPAPGYLLNRSTGEILELLPVVNLDYACSYSIANDGAATVTLSRDEEILTYKGSVSTDGSSFTLAGQSGTEQSVALMTGNKTGSNIGQSNVTGSYGIARIALGFPSGAESRAMAGRGTISFNGSGGCSASFIDGEYSQTLPSGIVADYSGAGNFSCSYSVGQQGILTISFGNFAASYQGHVSADGSSLTVAGLDHLRNTVMLLAGERLSFRYPYADIAGNWVGAGIKTPVKDTTDRDLMAQRFGYDVQRMVLHADGSGTSEAISTSDPSGTIEQVPAGTVAILDEEAMRQVRDDYSFMSSGKDVMFHFAKDPQAGEQQLTVNLKQAGSYSMADLTGTWMSAGIKTPARYNDDPALFGYDLRKILISSDGSGYSTTISSSETAPGASVPYPAGAVTIASDGAVTIPSIDHSYLNAAKDVMLQFDSANGAQQLFVNVKQGTNYMLQDLAGTWYGTGIKTPLEGSASANFGYEVVKLTVNSSGTEGNGTRLSSSNPIDLYISNILNFTSIASDGAITTRGQGSFFLNAGKNVLVQVRESGSDQQLFVYLKEAPLPVFPLNGACGSANGASFASTPATNLCSSGSASPLTGSGPWSWSCSGENGGAPANCSANADVITWTLMVTVAGNGAVNGSSNRSDADIISCTNDSTTGCSASYRAGEQVQLTATPGAGFLFGTWSGSVSGGANSLPIIMDGDKTVTATFNPVPKVMVASKGFATLQAAYDDAGTVDDSAIRLLEGFLPGSFTAWKNIRVKIEGGYNETFASRTSSTFIPGPFKVKLGQVRVQGVKIKPQ